METDIIVVLISSVVAILTAISSALYAYYVTDRQKQKQERDVEELRSALEDKNAERDARRDYEYEARKKLYEEYEPLFFRFSETAEGAYFRIRSLANRAAEGKLESEGWLKYDRYYLQSTLYYLMAPLANYKLFRGKLTYVDLRVDKSIYSIYILGKVLFVSFSDAFSIAEKMKLSYSPFEETKDKRQDLPIGVTENIAELLIETDSSGMPRVMNLAKFQDVFNTSTNGDLSSFKEMLKDFHPQRLPVLWSVLIVQAIIYQVVKSMRRDGGLANKEMLLDEVSKEAKRMKLSDFEWRNELQKQNVTDQQLNDMFSFANEYLRETIEGYY